MVVVFVYQYPAAKKRPPGLVSSVFLIFLICYSFYFFFFYFTIWLKTASWYWKPIWRCTSEPLNFKVVMSFSIAGLNDKWLLSSLISVVNHVWFHENYHARFWWNPVTLVNVSFSNLVRDIKIHFVWPPKRFLSFFEHAPQNEAIFAESIATRTLC